MSTSLVDIILRSIFIAGVGVAISLYAIPVIRNICIKKGLVDDPNDERKVHQSVIPTLGGVAIYASFFVSYSLLGSATDFMHYPMLAGALAILFFVGMKDDLLMISPYKKLGGQLLAAGLIVYSGIRISGFGGLFGVHSLSYEVSILFTLFTIIVLINAYNLIDGIDGLAGGIGMIAALTYGIWFLQAGYLPSAYMSFALAGSLLGYLAYNFHPANIFMGDTGSMIVGFIISVLTVRFIDVNVSGEVVGRLNQTAPLLAIAVLIVPLYDTLRVVLVRGLERKSPFSPGNEHVHHEFLQMGFNQKSTALILYSITAGFILFVVSTARMNVNLLFVLMVVGSLIVFPTRYLKRYILEQLGFEMGPHPDPKKEGVYLVDNGKKAQIKANGEGQKHKERGEKQKIERSEKMEKADLLD